MGCIKSSSKRVVYSNKILPQEIRKTQNRKPNFTPKKLEKEEEKQQQNQQKERNHKDQTEIIENEMKETVKINNTKTGSFRR